MDWYLGVLRNYTGFSGRARRKEYWFFTLFNVLVVIALSMLDAMIGTFDAETGYGALSTVYMLAVLIPSLAVSFRRLHDTNRSAWWLLLGLVPLIGTLVLLVFMILEGTEGSNDYGPDPKQS
jgi:uncharacterized membrane protein YhaH (DUF805 family)